MTHFIIPIIRMSAICLIVTICHQGWSQVYFPLEKDYADYIQTLIGGEREVQVESGRIDLLTDEYAIEIKRAPRWKEAVGQSLWYALQKVKKPGIILILENPREYKYFQQLNSALEYANLDHKVKVWAYPYDFEHLIDSTHTVQGEK